MSVLTKFPITPTLAKQHFNGHLILRCSVKKSVRVRRVTVSIFQAVNLWQLAARMRPELLHVSVCLQGKQIKDASHFRGCKSAPGDGSGVSDTPNPP